MTDIELTNNASDVLIYGFIMLMVLVVGVLALHLYVLPAIKEVRYFLAKALYWALRSNHESTSFGFGPCNKGTKGKGYTRGY